MSQEEKEGAIRVLYESLQPYKHRHNSNVLYNLIHAKIALELENYNRALYVDVKKFIVSYISSTSNADYGYDDISLDKIFNVVGCLKDIKQRQSALRLVKRLFVINGYDADEILIEINKIEIKVKQQDGQYFHAFMLWVGSSVWKLLLSYFFYVVLVGVVLLPSPFPFMEVFEVELKEYSDNPIINHLSNTLALVSGNDTISPDFTPIGLVGNVVYCIGILAFYFFFVNYVFRKIEDRLSIK